MKLRVLIAFVLVSSFSMLSCFSQIKAKAISYNLTVDLTKFAGTDAAEELSQKTCTFEIDAYYTSDKLKTIVRIVSRPADYEMGIRQRLYDLKSKDEYNIDHDNTYMMIKKDQNFKATPTGKQKMILGYSCKEYMLTDYRKVNITVWVTDKLQFNVCPAGNYSLKGTALEVELSNGLHYVATDFAEGIVDANFFDPPKNYQEEVVPAPAIQKSK
jgi:GLPGLI family protein